MSRKKVSPTPADLAGRASAAKDRFARIKCPRQRAVARRVGEICDLFCAGLSRLPTEERLVDQGAGRDAAERLRNSMRIYALGGVFALGKELGLYHEHLHGQGDGTTQIAELKKVHRTTAVNAAAAFQALVEDGGDFGRVVAARWATLKAGAEAEVAERWTQAKAAVRRQRAV